MISKIDFNEEIDSHINYESLYNSLLKQGNKETFDDEMDAFVILDKLTNGKHSQDCIDSFYKKHKDESDIK